MGILNVFRVMREWLTGRNVIASRLDLIQTRLDSLLIDDKKNHGFRKIEEIVLKLEESISSLQQEVSKKNADSSFGAFLPIPMFSSPSSCNRVGRSDNRLAFLLHSLELCNHFGPVWDVLPNDSFDVLLHGPDEIEAQQALKGWKCGIRTTREVLDSAIPYSFLVSNHPVDISETPLIKRLAHYNVRFMYAAGKSGWNLSSWNDLYDVILSFGPYHARAFEAVSDAIVVNMGYPRFDRYFNKCFHRSDLLSRYGCDPSRKTVVWLPTWKTLSSVGWFDEEISELTSTYNVVVKLHPLLSEQEPQRVNSLRKYHFNCLITDTSDNLSLYQLADYMLFDYGGPPLAGHIH